MRHQFGGEQMRSDPGWGAYGWRDLPLDLAHQRYREAADEIDSALGDEDQAAHEEESG